MKLKLALIRHGCDSGGKLVGITDKPLGGEGERLIRKKMENGDYPVAELVFSSNLARCIETARIIYPKGAIIMMKELCAPDYGDFECKFPSEISAESFAGGNTPIEESYAISARGIAAFKRIIDEMAGKGLEHVSVISHKMVIQAILQRYYVPRSNYINWEIPYGGGYIVRYDTLFSTAEIAEKL